MRFEHAGKLRADFPELVAGVVAADGIRPDTAHGLSQRIDAFTATASARLAAGPAACAGRSAQLRGPGLPLSEFPEIQAWRRAFAGMGLKPTQYRCAAEALLRRFAKEGALPRIHPLVDLCNALSMAYAVPVAVLDLARVSGDLSVCYATGTEAYETFGGAVEHPEPGEVSFVDGSGRAHARRWTNRQSGYSAVRAGTTSVLVVAEALHASAEADIADLTATLVAEIGAFVGGTPQSAVLTGASPATVVACH
jgi:DNA/RNA-binding domain of Phe-tRNA-synthetase-like protein